MERKQLCAFGVEVKKKLVELNKSQIWLAQQVADDTNLYFDGSYLNKILTGKSRNGNVIGGICRVLDLELPAERTDPQLMAPR